MCIPFLISHTAYKCRFTKQMKKKMQKRNVYSVSDFPHGLHMPFHKEFKKIKTNQDYKFQNITWRRCGWVCGVAEDEKRDATEMDEDCVVHGGEKNCVVEVEDVCDQRGRRPNGRK